MQSYEHNKRGMPTSYCVDIEALRLPFFGRKNPARAGTGASSNPELRIEFAVERIGAIISI